MLKNLTQYLRLTAGSVAVAFGLAIPAIIGAVGVSVDISQAYLVQERLSHALDAAALAAAASSETDQEVIEQRVQDFIDANYPPGKVGYTLDIDVVINDNEIAVTGNARLDTSFMRIVGIETVDVSTSTVVQRDVLGIEVALVLDNTGSMSENDNIIALKEATTNFINVMFDETSDPETVKIGLVPYSNSVRVGHYGLGQNADGTPYDSGYTFVTLPTGMTYTTTHDSYNWYGCVVEHEATNYSTSATHVSNSKGQLWMNGSSWNGHGWNPGSSSNDPYPDDTLDGYEGPWDIYAYGRLITSGQKCSDYSNYSNSRCSNCTGSSSKCNSSYCFCWMSTSNGGSNYYCPYAMIQPLTSSRETLLAQVEPDDDDDMVPHGNTMGNIGMAWGYRLLSPERPFTEGHDWDDEDWKKVIIMMTDGDNTLNGTYSSYWFKSKNQMTVTKLNQRFEETCDAIKAENPEVMIYTITFTSNITPDTKDYYRRCASSEDKYYDAPTQSELIDVFNRIARELSNLRIKE